MKHLGLLVVGRHFNRHELGDQGRPIVQIGDLKDPRRPRRRFGGRLPERYEVRPGDLLITQMRPVRVRRWSGEIGWLGPRLVKFDPDLTRVDLRFAFHALTLRLPDLDDQLQGTTIPHLSATALGELQLPMPTLEIQNQLGPQLDDTIDLGSQLDSTLQALRRLSAERLAGFTEELAFPTDVPLARLKFLFNAAPATADEKPGRELMLQGEDTKLVPAARTGGRRGGNGRMTRALAAGDLVVRRLASGALATAIAEQDGQVGSHLLVLVPRQDVDPRFFAHVLRTRHVRAQIGVRDEERHRFGLSQLLDVHVPALPLSVQVDRARDLDYELTVVEEVDRTADLAEPLIRSWTQRRMTDLLSGRRRDAQP
jgi:hypothetical protein